MVDAAATRPFPWLASGVAGITMICGALLRPPAAQRVALVLDGEGERVHCTLATQPLPPLVKPAVTVLRSGATRIVFALGAEPSLAHEGFHVWSFNSEGALWVDHEITDWLFEHGYQGALPPIEARSWAVEARVKIAQACDAMVTPRIATEFFSDDQLVWPSANNVRGVTASVADAPHGRFHIYRFERRAGRIVASVDGRAVGSARVKPTNHEFELAFGSSCDEWPKLHSQWDYIAFESLP